MTLYEYLNAQKTWSLKTFGPGNAKEKADGLLNHIIREVVEVDANPMDTFEWIDIVILGLEGALRSKGTIAEVIDVMIEKQLINEARDWPDWRDVPEGQPIEHIK